MAQVGFTPISTYYTTTAGATPTAGNLVNGELAININTADGKLFYKDSAGVVQTLATKDSAAGSFVNLAYTGTLTGGTGVVNLGSGQFYKDASGNVGIGTNSPSQRLHVYQATANTDCATFQIGSASAYTGFNNYRVGTSGSGTFIGGTYTPDGSLTGLQGTNGLIFSTSGGNTERMRIDSSGNVGIGIANPTRKLTLYATSVPTFQLCDATSGTTSSDGLIFQQNGVDSYAINQETGIFAFGTSNAEKMRIDSSGNLLVGTTTTNQSHRIVGKTSGGWNTQFWSTFATADQNYGIQIYYTAAAPNSSASQFIQCIDNASSGTVRFQVKSNGGIDNYSANNSNLSDSREKINVNPAGNYLAKICSIPVRTYNYIDQNLEEDVGLTLGVFAQDVQEVAPELVTESNWGSENEPKMRLSIYQTDFQYALMKCIQEQQVMIEELKAKVAALEAA